MALTDKYATPIDRLMVILQGMTIDKLKLVLRFAEFLAEKDESGV